MGEFNLFGIYMLVQIFVVLKEIQQKKYVNVGCNSAFNPFFRNQDPENFSASIIESNRHVVETRYTLIPHLCTLFHRVHISGGTVVRSMAHEFLTDPSC
jgi:hypothetical protein